MMGWFAQRPIFELRDLWPESIRAVGALRGEHILGALERIELFLYRKADAVISVTQAFKENLIERGIDPDKIQVITNGVDTSRFSPMAKDAQLMRQLDLEGAFVAGYIGTHGLAHGLDTVIDAAHLLALSERGSHVRIVMLGDGAHRHRLQERARTLGLSNIIFIDTVPKDQVARYWSILDASIVHLMRSDLFTTVIPSKIFECMGLAIPIVHGVEGESADIVLEHDVGVTFEPENHIALVDRILLLKDNVDLRERLARNGPAAAKYYNRATLAGQMLDIIKSCAK